ncbi:uncharacterized protein LOC117780615 [Drosophila innubila]|uniref:uncharacterized protein LOC117780615 n=1 Tax=Drosophila innubila TaxID=198719 RepID=UPI00148BB538|nr:uncharacterized protein LOC117780615 [Drosophila innubila]
MSGMQPTLDVSCIKKEDLQEEEEFEEEEWNSNIVKCIKVEYMELAENQLLPTEIEVGPVKIEENVYNNIKMESKHLLHVEKAAGKVSARNLIVNAAKETKSNNRREVVRIFHQRLMSLDMATDKFNSSSSSLQIRHKDLIRSPSISNAEHMRELRQRLMNLDKSITPTKKHPAKTSNQLNRELEQRQMQHDSVNTTKRNTIPKEIIVLPPRTPPKSGAQRMRELRQRRRDLQSANQSRKEIISQCTNSRPPTPPELSVKRMRELRQRLLNLDQSLKANSKNREQ